MIRKPDTLNFWVGRLPHWEVEDGQYFITIHLAGAIPAQGRERIRAISDQFKSVGERNSPKWLRVQRSIFREMEAWLDRSEWNAKLRNENVAMMVNEAIEHRHNCGDWNMVEYVVMPTHVHLFCEIGNKGLKSTLEDFKRWTGHQAAKLLEIDAKRFWQREWFDHWSRSDEEDERIVRYIRKNPEKAGLVNCSSDWPYSSFSK